MNINVNDKTRNLTVTVQCSPDETVGSLIAKSRALLGGIATQTAFYYGQTQLDPNSPISAYSIPDMATITINYNKRHYYAQSSANLYGTPAVGLTPQVQGIQKREYVIPWQNSEILIPREPSTSYFRFSSTLFPDSFPAFTQLKVPLGIAVRPADVMNQQVFDYRSQSFTKCVKCGCMLCPQVKLTPDNQNWICPACKTLNQIITPIMQAPEYSSQVYDVLVGPDPLSRNARPAAAFVLDMSELSVLNGLTLQFIYSLKASLDALPQNYVIHIITISNSLTYFDLTKHEEVIFPDLKDVFYMPSEPLPLSESRAEIDSILDLLINRLQYEQPLRGHCLGNGIELACQIMKQTGGLLFTVYTGIPTVGPHQLTERHTGEKDETVLLRLAQNGDFWRKLAFLISRSGISLHTFNAGPQYGDLATDAVATGLSSGSCHHYHYFDDAARMQLHTDLFRILTKDMLWDATMSLKLPPGILLRRAHGNCISQRNVAVGALFGALQPDDSIVLELEYMEDPRFSGEEVFVQVQLTFTDIELVRHIRVFSFAVKTTKDINAVRQSIDESACMSLLIRTMTSKLLSAGVSEASKSLMETYKMMITCKWSIQSMPYMIHSLLCNDLMKTNHQEGPDGRLALVIRIRSIDVVSLLLLLYPRLFAFAEDGSTSLLPLTGSSFSYGTCFVAHTIDRIYIWVSHNAPQQLINDVFGVTDVTNIPGDVPETGTPLNKAMLDLINECRTLSGCYLPVTAIPQGSMEERVFGTILVDDIKGNEMTYADFQRAF